jgi:hypothetical protein
LEGTIKGPGLISDSVVSKYGIRISMSADSVLINIRTTGNTSTSDIDCYLFVLRNLVLYTIGTGNAISIQVLDSTLMPRQEFFYNIAGSSYLICLQVIIIIN